MWQLASASPSEAAEWATLLQLQMKKQYPDGVLATPANEKTRDLPGLGLWMAKRGEGLGALAGDKKRYFLLQEGVDTVSTRPAPLFT